MKPNAYLPNNQRHWSNLKPRNILSLLSFLLTAFAQTTSQKFHRMFKDIGVWINPWKSHPYPISKKLTSKFQRLCHDPLAITLGDG